MITRQELEKNLAEFGERLRAANIKPFGVQCIRCHGKGTVSKWLLFSKECPRCGGRGEVLLW